MPLGIRVKFWLFEYYGWLVCIAVAAAIVMLFVMKERVTTIMTVVGSLLSVAYFLQKQKLEELRIFREIFKECNERYDAMNDFLIPISEREKDEGLSAEEILKIIDYLNLCGEEYLYFKRGYIEPSVWQAWHNGMKKIISSPCIINVWKKEKETGSYYDLPL
jgi:hypothetical protein